MPIQNVFGSKGSHIADLMIQVFGTASYLIVITAFVWGVRAWKRLRLGPVYLRVTALITCLIFSAIALARIPSGAGTPTPYSGGSAGGPIGDHVLLIASHDVIDGQEIGRKTQLIDQG